jgi:glycerol-3-phosphate O-acyltransferase
MMTWNPTQKPNKGSPVVDNLSLTRRIRSGHHSSAMVKSPTLIGRYLGKKLFGQVRFGRRLIERLSLSSEKNTIVYVLQSRSLLDYLYFNFAFLTHGLPLVRFANGVSTRWLRPIRESFIALFRRSFPADQDVFSATLKTGESSLLFLNAPQSEALENEIYNQEFLLRLVKHGLSDSGKEIALVPLLLVWDKRSESYRRTLFDEFFGTRQAPGRIRKLFLIVQNIWQSLLRAGAPTVQIAEEIPLGDFITTNRTLTPHMIGEKLREQLLSQFNRDRQVMVGPPVKPANMIRSEVLSSPEVRRAIKENVKSEKIFRPSSIENRAKKLIKEIAADFNLVAIKFLSALISPICDALYQGFDIDAEGMERVRKIARDHRLILVPSHKSHMDYLIVSNIFYQHGLMPPHIAAGVNLSFWPLGPIFRRAGAFFIRRSFKGDKLYSALFTEYFMKILDEGFPIEFFIEGTRSRTGKLSQPRYGMMTMLLHAVTSGRLERAVIIPISINYERVVEGGAHSREVLGGDKEKENISGILKASRVLRTKHGRVYIEFEEPLYLDEYVTKHGLKGANQEQVSFEKGVRRLSYQVIDGINKCTTITPSAIVSTALLNHPKQEMREDRLHRELGFIVRYLVERGGRLSNSIAHALAATREIVGDEDRRTDEMTAISSDTLYQTNTFNHNDQKEQILTMSEEKISHSLVTVTKEAIKLFEEADQLKILTKDGKEVYALEEKRRPDLSYYRNSIIHFFVRDAILATALLASESKRVLEKEVKSRTYFLSTLFKHEFCFGPRDSFDEAFHSSLSVFVEMGWLTLENDLIVRPEKPAAGTEFLRGLLLNWIEGYWVVASSLHILKEEDSTKGDLINACIKNGRRLYQKKELLFYESISKPTFKHAIEAFIEQGIVVIDDKNKEQYGDDMAFSLSPEFQSTERLEEVARELGIFRRRPDRSLDAPLRSSQSGESMSVHL